MKADLVCVCVLSTLRYLHRMRAQKIPLNHYIDRKILEDVFAAHPHPPEGMMEGHGHGGMELQEGGMAMGGGDMGGLDMAPDGMMHHPEEDVDELDEEIEIEEGIEEEDNQQYF